MIKSKIEKDMPTLTKVHKAMSPKQRALIKKMLEENKTGNKSKK